ncbi:DUF5703 domain-containing protein [Pontiella sulfatireligans]|uniref:DUF5703 domain-containing protein n=1 Tax=Pontiella sulfatireligans TaxID=2750658 RepID=A0A6C2UFC1_9BACT|nr:DUF5703 domain-containing protein [Pontiella sulfatireligans]VGO18870.1 hypothetical protein SCARR_00923 [Pontiella sulfatireligans]
MNNRYIMIALNLAVGFMPLFSLGFNPDQYNVLWKTQSKNSSESMPVGGHSIGLNAWVEDGDILFYAQRSGSFDENNEYFKLGRFRVQLTPNPFEPGASFEQELKLHEGFVQLRGSSKTSEATVNIWVEALRPVIHVDVQGETETTAVVSYEGWRNEAVELPDESQGARFGCFSWEGYPGQVISYPDVVEQQDNGVLFYHRNRDDQLLIDFMIPYLGLDEVKNQIVNTQKGRTFGGYLTGDGFVQDGTGEATYVLTPYKAWKLRSVNVRNDHHIRIYTHVAQTDSLKRWQQDLEKQRLEGESDAEARWQTLNWWNAFWNRSHLVINADDTDSKAWTLGRNYQLFRYQMGCNWYGEYPTKFNGGNFTFDPSLVKSKKHYSPDFRNWGGGSFTAQNQRLLYWPLLKTGDFEAMIPQLEFYRRMLSAGKARVKTYFGHEGAYFCEQTENFGLPILTAWGWKEPEAKKRNRPPDLEPGVLQNKYIVYHYESQLEYSYMMLEYHRYSGADISDYMEFIKESIRFFDAHYQMRNQQLTGQALDKNGKLVIYPSTSCETYKNAKNPADVVAGLEVCLESLLALNDSGLTDEERRYFTGMQQRLPGYFYDTVDGDQILKPAESWKGIINNECPQFYPLFPFNRFTLNDEDAMEVFRNTWKHGTFRKDTFCSWHQDGIFLARMGMVQDAVDFNTKKMRDSGRRFPTFWGPGHDWAPDHNWGGSGMIGLQEMLLQTVDDEIRLFPAWPKEWDVDFKLHAPQNTVIEGVLRDGQFTLKSITPESRRKDIINMLE